MLCAHSDDLTHERPFGTSVGAIKTVLEGMKTSEDGSLSGIYCLPQIIPMIGMVALALTRLEAQGVKIRQGSSAKAVCIEVLDELGTVWPLAKRYLSKLSLMNLP